MAFVQCLLVDTQLYPGIGMVIRSTRSFSLYGETNTPCDQSYQMILDSLVSHAKQDEVLINLECCDCKGEHNWSFKRLQWAVHQELSLAHFAMQMYPTGGIEFVENKLVPLVAA